MNSSSETLSIEQRKPSMAVQTKRWFINQEGPNPQSLQIAFSWLQRQMTTSPAHQGLLAVPVKKTLENIKGVLGEDIAKQLQKNNTAQLKSGKLHLMTESIRRSSWAGPVLVLYPPQRLLDSVDELQSASEILVVPWSVPEVQAWIQMWDIYELGDTSPHPPKTFSNPTVRAALESLTTRINLSTGLSHPSDEAAAIEMFRLLHVAGEVFNPDEVKSWLVSELGWRRQQANEAAEIAQKVLSGRTLRAANHPRWASDIVSMWREEGSKYFS